MVGLRDIPCVGVALDEISVATVEAAIRGLRYMICYNRFLNDLNSEIEKVEIQEKTVERKIVEAKNDGMIIEDHVVAWQGKVENVKTQADELTRQTASTTCFKVVHFPNPVSRLRLGRKAAHLSKTVIEHTDSGKELLTNEIAHYAPDENVPNSDTSYQKFDSRQEAYEKLWEALVNKDGYPIIGIYGMPGVGKTRMMERAWEELQEKKIFDKVIRANVGGEKIDVLNLQNQLSDYLKCHLESKDHVDQRASQLKRSLMNAGKVLVILDDVWDLIPLNQIGIPLGNGSSKDCKILLTSRKKTVCNLNKCTDPIKIEALKDGEAWQMFRNTVGTLKIESMEDPSLAKKVCKECGGLPLLIDAVGKALKVSTENFWKDALYQLENCQFQDIDGIDPRVYNGLKFSFEKLGKGEKACLLLCSFFPEDADININMLFDMATGSQLLESGRNIVGLVDSLKSSSLLLEGKDDAYVKVHDVIRDVARSIATRDPYYGFLSLRCTSRLWDNAECPTRRLLHLDLEEENVGFPVDLVCRELHTLWMQSNTHSQQLSSEFLNAFLTLKVLLLRGKFLFDKKLTIHKLEKLRVLILDDCKISQTFLSSVSGNLEILCIRGYDFPSPVDLPALKNLRKLELVDTRSWKIKIVENGVWRLSRLEELIVPGGFINDDESICWELSQLRCLRNLVIQLNKWWHYPDTDILSRLVEFNINVAGSIFDDHGGWHDRERRKYVRFQGIDIEGWWMPLGERAEHVTLKEISGMPINGLSDSNMEEAFAKLKSLTIYKCEEMEHVASWWEKGRNQRLQCFRNLTCLNISTCWRLKYVFSYSVAKCLLQLQTLEVYDCDYIKEIIRVEEESINDDDGHDIIRFPNLHTLHLERLPNLVNFCRKKVTCPNLINLWIKTDGSLWIKTEGNIVWLLEEILDYSSSKLRTLSLSSHRTKQLLPSQLKLKLQNLEDLRLDGCWWAGQNSLFNGSLTFNSLKCLIIDECGEISSLFTASVFRSLHQLQWLNISNCSFLKQIVDARDDDDDSTNDHNTPISLLHLHSLTLSNLPNLQNIKIFACHMPELAYVDVRGCGLITSLFTRCAFTNLQHLRNLKVSACSLLEEIVEGEMDDATPGLTQNMISLPRLTSIELVNLPRLRSFSSSTTLTFNFPALTYFYQWHCPPMEISSLT